MSKWGGWPASGFGGRLKRLREAAGLTQEQLAERAGCNQFTVAKLEGGRQEPAWPLVLQLADALGVSTEEFRSRGDEPDTAPRRRGRPPKQKADGQPPPAPPAPPPAEDLDGQAEAGPAASTGAKLKRQRARRPKGT
jgi:transcriptional regulator with XRE-family HTH domain